MKKDLTKGKIMPTLWKLALPIMGTSVLNMAYNMADMFWLGKLGSESVAAVGTAGFYISLGYAILALAFVGGGILVAHRLGEGEKELARRSGENAILLSAIISLIYIVVVLITKDYLISFFNLSEVVTAQALDYITITIWSVLLTSITMAISRVMNSYGNSKIPFYISSIGLGLNILLDPIMIFTMGLGVRGAGLATILSKVLVVSLFMAYLIKNYSYFTKGIDIDLEKMKKLIKLGFPVTLQRTLFTSVSIVLGKLVATWGAEAVAAQRIALQIESISFMTAGGFQGALAAFIGQNYGAKKYLRIREGYLKGLSIIGTVAILVTILFLTKGSSLVALFIEDEVVVNIGRSYLFIIAISQVFMALEMTTVGAFQGVGKTFPPSSTSIVFTLMRIPLALFLVNYIDLNGVWWSISLSSIVKGIVLSIWFAFELKGLKRKFGDIKLG